MPRKIREIESAYRAADFKRTPGKGSHRLYTHPTGVKATVSGSAGADAQRYQENELADALEEVRRLKGESDV